MPKKKGLPDLESIQVEELTLSELSFLTEQCFNLLKRIKKQGENFYGGLLNGFYLEERPLNQNNQYSLNPGIDYSNENLNNNPVKLQSISRYSQVKSLNSVNVSQIDENNILSYLAPIDSNYQGSEEGYTE